MPNRSLRIIAAGRRDLEAALGLAFGDSKIKSYRFDKIANLVDRPLDVRRGDTSSRLFLMSATADTLRPPADGEEIGQVSYFPAELTPAAVAPIVEAFLEEGRMPPSPDMDGSLERGGFELALVDILGRGVIVSVRPAWREFHK
jgi:hypothetical protein